MKKHHNNPNQVNKPKNFQPISIQYFHNNNIFPEQNFIQNQQKQQYISEIDVIISNSIQQNLEKFKEYYNMKYKYISIQKIQINENKEQNIQLKPDNNPEDKSNQEINQQQIEDLEALKSKNKKDLTKDEKKALVALRKLENQKFQDKKPEKVQQESIKKPDQVDQNSVNQQKQIENFENTPYNQKQNQVKFDDKLYIQSENNQVNDQTEKLVTKPAQNQSPSILQKKSPLPGSTLNFQHLIRKQSNINIKDGQDYYQILQHPALNEIGLKFIHDKICGSSARCIAFLQALQKIITDFQYDSNLSQADPPNLLQQNSTQSQISQTQNFSRRIDKLLDIILSQIEKYRSVTEGMRTAHKFCKNVIQRLFYISDNISQQIQKEWFCKQINIFIQQKIISADELIIKSGMEFIKDGDFIMVFARSKVVEDLIIHAHQAKKVFTIIIVDNPPFHEGKTLLKNLSQSGIKCMYTVLSHAAYFMKKVTKIFVGASALLSNGALVSRIGTALLACITHDYKKPFVVFCESYKFSEKSQLDSLSWNELARNFNKEEIDKPKGENQMRVKKISIENQPMPSSQDIDINPINLRYDLTPCDFIDMVVTELGPLPPTSVPHIIREFLKHDYIGKIELPVEQKQQN